MCFVTASVSRKAGGLQEGVLRLAQFCGSPELSVLGIQDEYSASDIAAWSPLQIRTSPTFGPERFSFAPGLAKCLDEGDFALAHLHGLWRYTSIAISRWHRRSSRPYIVHPHGMLDGWAVRNSRWKKMIASTLYERAMLNQAACIRALCQSEADSIRNYGCKNPICIIPNGIDLPKGPFSSPPWRSYLDPDAKILLYLGRLHPKKGLRNLLQAWARVQDARNSDRGWKGARQWTLAIAGWEEGRHELELKRLADELGIQWADLRESNDGISKSPSEKQKTALFGPGGLIFLGPQFGRTKANCYHHCDAFILPSLSEGLPMVILEAWAHGKPVLMTSGCNLPEGITANAAIEIGVIPDEILPGLRRLFAMSPAGLNEMGKQGASLVSEKFSWERVSAQLLTVSDWVLRGGPRPDSVCRGLRTDESPGAQRVNPFAGHKGKSSDASTRQNSIPG
jgi:glycosyltransferase involved in cell wall biosynthesis